MLKLTSVEQLIREIVERRTKTPFADRRALADRYGFNDATIRQWKRREKRRGTADVKLLTVLLIAEAYGVELYISAANPKQTAPAGNLA